jgi:hypothetical protein
MPVRHHANRATRRTPSARTSRSRLGALAVMAMAGAAMSMLPSSGIARASHPTVEQQVVTHVEQECLEPGADIATSARGGRAHDHRGVSRAEQRRIKDRTEVILAGQTPRQQSRAAARAASIPVYVHVMAGSSGEGDVDDSAIVEQIEVLNASYAGLNGDDAADTGFTFTLAGTDRYYNDTWHADGATTTYRSQTRRGGADALNIWLVDFDYLGVATFPWDYSTDGDIDGIRVQYTSLPGGVAPFDLGETATHEAGHWLGLYHTFQGSCSITNDEVGDTPAQSSPSSGCPEGRNSCSAAGVDPIHNYMDYSDDACYTEFTGGQSTRMTDMFAAYRS